MLRRGVAATPELRQGIFFTALMALATAAGKLAVPVLIQQILDGVPQGGGSARNSSIPPVPAPPSPWSCCTWPTASPTCGW